MAVSNTGFHILTGDEVLSRLTALRAEYVDRNRIIATEGPLTYGLIPSGEDWVWSISVGSANPQHVRLDPAKIVHRADRVGLSSRWNRLGARHAALEARL